MLLEASLSIALKRPGAAREVDASAAERERSFNREAQTCWQSTAIARAEVRADILPAVEECPGILDEISRLVAERATPQEAAARRSPER